jgi:hypothetical protein
MKIEPTLRFWKEGIFKGNRSETVLGYIRHWNSRLVCDLTAVAWPAAAWSDAPGKAREARRPTRGTPEERVESYPRPESDKFHLQLNDISISHN